MIWVTLCCAKSEFNKATTGACAIKNYGPVMYGLRNELVCLLAYAMCLSRLAYLSTPEDTLAECHMESEQRFQGGSSQATFSQVNTSLAM
jgi:hypothetical protein